MNLRKIMILVVVLLAAFVLFYSIPFSWFGSGKHHAAVTGDTELIILDVSGITTKIVTKKRDDVEASLDGKGKLQVSERGNRIEIEYKRRWFESFSFFSGPKLTIYMPEDYHQDMEIEMGSGNLNYEGKSNDEPIVLNELNVDVNSGNVKLTNIQTTEGTFDISSGNVGVDHYKGKLTADISSGNINVQLDQLTNSVEVDVSSGHATIDLPDDANFTLDGNVNSGSISNSFTLGNLQENTKEISGVHGSGEHPVEISVSSGRIVLK